MENKAAFPLYHGFYKKGIPEASYSSLSAHALQPMQVSFGSVSNEGHISWRMYYLFVCIWASKRGLLLKCRTAHCACATACVRFVGISL